MNETHIRSTPDPLTAVRGSYVEEEHEKSIKKTLLMVVVRVFSFDIGLSIFVGLLIGALSGAFVPEGLALDMVVYGGTLLGLLISLYAAYLLRQVTKNVAALAYLLTFGVLTSVVSWLQDVEASPAFMLFASIAGLLAYGVGWFVGKMSFGRLYVPGKAWLTLCMVVGYIGIVIMLVGLVLVVALDVSTLM